MTDATVTPIPVPAMYETREVTKTASGAYKQGDTIYSTPLDLETPEGQRAATGSDQVKQSVLTNNSDVINEAATGLVDGEEGLDRAANAGVKFFLATADNMASSDITINKVMATPTWKAFAAIVFDAAGIKLEAERKAASQRWQRRIHQKLAGMKFAGDPRLSEYTPVARGSRTPKPATEVRVKFDTDPSKLGVYGENLLNAVKTLASHVALNGVPLAVADSLITTLTETIGACSSIIEAAHATKRKVVEELASERTGTDG